MSHCIRTISNKLTPYVAGTRKSVTRLDRQLPRRDVNETSAFLVGFFRDRTAEIQKQTLRNCGRNSNFIVSDTGSIKTTSDNIVEWNYKLKRDGNCSYQNNESGKYVVENIVRNVGVKSYVDDEGLETQLFLAVPNENEAPVVKSEERSGSSRLNPVKSEESERQESGRPTMEHLDKVYTVLHVDLPKFFTKTCNYSIYHPEVVFENNIKGTVTKGIFEYIKQASMLRIYGHCKFAYIKMEVLKITVHPEDDSIKVRWRIRAITGLKVFLNFWKFKIFKLQEAIERVDVWYDGFSTFYVDGNGAVVKHVADKMMPNQDTEITEKDKTGIAAKLALFLSLLAPRDFFSGQPFHISSSSQKDYTSNTTINHSISRLN